MFYNRYQLAHDQSLIRNHWSLVFDECFYFIINLSHVSGNDTRDYLWAFNSWAGHPVPRTVVPCVCHSSRSEFCWSNNISQPECSQSDFVVCIMYRVAMKLTLCTDIRVHQNICQNYELCPLVCLKNIQHIQLFRLFSVCVWYYLHLESFLYVNCVWKYYWCL